MTEVERRLGDVQAWAVIALLIALFSLAGVFRYRAQLRDIQRRVAELEQPNK